MHTAVASVVIPTLNETGAICACLDSVLAQSEREIEVLVVDGGSTDTTRDLVESYQRVDPRIRLIDNPKRTQPCAMNVAASHIRSQYLIRVDAHSTVPPRYVEQALSHLRTNKWGGVGGRKDGVALTPQGHAVAAALGSPVGVGNSTYHHGTTATVVDHIPFGAYPLEVVHDVGGWDETIFANEDYEFDYRVRKSGRELLFDPELVIFWQTRERVSDLFRQYRRYGRGKARVLAKHPESAAVRHLVPAGIVGALGLAVAVAPFRPRFSATIVAPYAALIAAGSAGAAPKLERESWKYLPAAFAAMHCGYGVGLIEETILGRPRKTGTV